MNLSVPRTERFYSDDLVADLTLGQRTDVKALAEIGVVPSLGVILPLDHYDRPLGPSQSYVARKETHGRDIGASSRELQVARYALGATITHLNTACDEQGRPLYHGTLLQLPLPAYPGESTALLEARTKPRLSRIDPRKDVDGVRPRDPDASFDPMHEFAAPTPAGIMDILYEQDRVPLAPGVRITVIGSESFLVGRHMSPLLQRIDITPTKHDPKLYDRPVSAAQLEANMRDKIAASDILISCVGRAGLITPDMLHDGMVLVDAGVSMVDGRLRGDLDPSIADAPLDVLYTGPTRDTGPMTVVRLWGNVILSATRFAAEASRQE